MRAVKALHTLVWVFFVACIAAIPTFALERRLGMALLFIGIVTVEVVILAANGWQCPLTAVAARYTDDRRPNFDIYLPLWLARYNKEIFGPLFLAGVLLTLARWVGWWG